MSYFEDQAVEQVARRCAHERTGFTLVAVEPVAMPLFRVTLRLVVQTVKELPPLPEFILKTMEVGVSVPAEIAEFLGVDDRIAKTVIADLSQSECISFSRTDDAVLRLTMTDKGARTLRASEIINPEEVRGSVIFDGLLRRPVSMSGAALLRPKDLKDSGLHELPPVLSAKPELSELSPGVVREVFRVPTRPGEGVKRRELLSVREIERSERLFQPAIALVYKAIGGSDVQVAFVIEQAVSGPHERAFAKGDGPRSTGLIQLAMDSAAVSDVAVQSLGQELIERAADPNVIAVAEKALTQAESRLEAAQNALQDASQVEEQREAEQAIGEAQGDVASAQNQLAAYTIRFLNTYDHPRFLDDALINSKDRLLIISPWIRSNVLTSDRLRRLQLLLLRGVDVFLGYGIEEDDAREPLLPDDAKLIAALESLAKQHANFHFLRLGDEHSKLLISDTRFIIVGSFNWLSFRGDRRRKHRGERSVLCTAPEKIEAQFQEVAGLFGVSRTQRAKIQMNRPEVSPTDIVKLSAEKAIVHATTREEPGPEHFVREGESKTQEFKSTFRWHIHAKKLDAVITHSSLKTIAAFLNSDGGKLWLGVDDSGASVGVEQDGFESEDKYLLHITHCVRESMGEHAAALIDPQFVTCGDKRVVRIVCSRSTAAVFLRTKQTTEEEFYVRSGPGSVKMPMSEAVQYMKSRFGP
jgi:hypothetical protein